ncbi:hypothetical protein [Agreia pratensis]|uniref:Uncharacterized protein n=1 Tax=Agreia pratensis TaxID=150121 RepID=A0A1X7L285_9MICO|nr:hypothetical protein [Agreia pratensis]SMG47513.1 hypothetical protein SAMN06296010_3204 [Agreia pratensis]
MSDDQSDRASADVESDVPEDSDPSHADPEAAFYDQDVVDPQTRRFATRVIGLGVVIAIGLLFGAISLIWPDALSDAVREMQGAH